jgi:glycosyltransferase involved in cell wall biosynthesis
VFHESERLGAGLSVVRALETLGREGWSAYGWFPGPGPLLAEAEPLLAGLAQYPKPMGASVRAWRRAPGVLARARQTPRYIAALARALREARPDVVHINSLLCLPEAALARALGFPVVLQLHELPQPDRKAVAALRAAATLSNVLIAVSGPVQRLLEANAGRTPVFLVRNGVPVKPASGSRQEEPVVGTIGYVSRKKGTDVFLQAAELAVKARTDLRFEHVGPLRLWGDDEFDERIDRLASSSALHGRVSLLGPRPAHEALERWFIFVLLSRSEAFPLSTLEAMAAGLPVVATSVGGIPEQITHLEDGILIPPDRPDIAADWIVRLHDEPALRGRIGTSARRRAATFTLAAQAEGLAGAYSAALARRRGRRLSRRKRAREDGRQARA